MQGLLNRQYSIFQFLFPVLHWPLLFCYYRRTETSRISYGNWWRLLSLKLTAYGSRFKDVKHGDFNYKNCSKRFRSWRSDPFSKIQYLVGRVMAFWIKWCALDCNQEKNGLDLINQQQGRNAFPLIVIYDSDTIIYFLESNQCQLHSDQFSTILFLHGDFNHFSLDVLKCY